MILCMSAGYKIGFLTGSKKRYIKSKFMFEKAKKIRIHLLEITIRYQYDTKVLQTMTLSQTVGFLGICKLLSSIINSAR